MYNSEQQGCYLCEGVTEWVVFLSGQYSAEKFEFCPHCGRAIKQAEPTFEAIRKELES